MKPAVRPEATGIIPRAPSRENRYANSNNSEWSAGSITGHILRWSGCHHSPIPN